MSDKKTMIVRKESAVKTGDLIRNSVGSLMAADVKPGVWLFGFDPTAPEHLQDVFLCDADGTRDWSQHTTEPFLLRTWAAQKILLPKTDTREESENVRTILIDPQGDTLSFVSAGVVSSLDLLRTLLGDGPFDPPVPVTIKRIETGAGRQILKLLPNLQAVLGKKK